MTMPTPRIISKGRLIAQRPLCGECNSRDVEAHATLSWNEQHQDWLIADVRDRGTCPGCGSTDVPIIWQNY
jgi:hypothetical protein